LDGIYNPVFSEPLIMNGSEDEDTEGTAAESGAEAGTEGTDCFGRFPEATPFIDWFEPAVRKSSSFSINCDRYIRFTRFLS